MEKQKLLIELEDLKCRISDLKVEANRVRSKIAKLEEEAKNEI